MNPEPRIVPLGTAQAPEIKEPSKDELLERLLQQANLFGTGNNQNGTGPRNPDKEKRAKRREQKLARRNNRAKW